MLMNKLPRRDKKQARILPTGVVQQGARPRKGDYIFDSQSVRVYIPKSKNFLDARIMAQGFLAHHGYNSEVRFRGVHK